ncbi:uncharacterized protein LOC110687919 [Chenopodium quinoa]|uniref:uncharacterized protein LOC110687919 n=1 Tax=Chenopodium quinoa TaxID=63459 RepID=UPI000B790814|nr:uncharacterized protein LOC110687919 [Chenopodium quinoa]
MSLEKGLQLYRKKNRIIDAIKLTMNHSVTCFRDNSAESAKIIQFSSIIHTFASVFPRLGLPAQLPGRLEFMVERLLDANMVDEVLELTSAPYPANLKIPFLELRMRAYYVARDMDGFWEVARVWEQNALFAYTETAYIYGTKLLEYGSLHKAINAFTSGFNMAESEEKKKKMEDMLTEAERRMEVLREHAPLEEIVPVVEENVPGDFQKVAQDDHQQAEHESERHEKELLEEEDVRITAELKKKAKKKEKREAKKEEKRKAKQLSMVKKAVEVAHESDEKVLEENKEKGSGSNLVEEREPLEFEQTLSVTMEYLDGNSFLGSTMINNIAKVKKSFIVAEPSHIDNIQELVPLCLTHDNLLKIDQVLKTLKGRHMLLSSEEVCSIEYFFTQKLNEIAPQSQESWWEAIKDMFWKIFRGLIRGLMHLFVRGKSCGELVFSAFVTSKGEGRIVPSMKQAKQQQDLSGLVDLMKTVIGLPFPRQSDLPFLPYHLKHFFDLINKADAFIPLEFLIDHPYFWNVAEKIDFTFKLRNLVKQKTAKIRSRLDSLDYFITWWDNLSDVYQLVYVAAAKRKMNKPYKQNVDIVRYFGAVYTHINEYEYKAARKHKRFTDEKIESDLAKIFPNFYVNMFYCLCSCISKRTLDYTDFKDVSPVLSLVA